MKNVMQMTDFIKLDNQNLIEIDEYSFFIKKDILEEEFYREEKKYQELCLTSLTICCTCD
jgi:hypothetical protein